jgi:hypothetical protein
MILLNQPSLLAKSMKQILAIIFVTACVITAGCNRVMDLAVSVPARAEWAQVQSKGGIKFGTPFRTNGYWCAPIECEATGQFVTREPDGVTSFPIYYSSAKMRLEDSTLLVFLMTKGDQSGYLNGRLTKVYLPKGVTSGIYNVLYLDKDESRHPVQKLIVPEQPLKTIE